MKATLFAHNGQITAISFPGESRNFNGSPVHDIDAPEADFEAALLAVAPQGVGSPWPAIAVSGESKVARVAKALKPTAPAAE